VGRLCKLSQQRGLFNDPGPEINELCGVLKRELGTLDRDMRALAEMAGVSAGVAEGSTDTGPRAHWRVVVETLNSHLMALTRGFQDALRARASTLSGAAGAMRVFSQSSWAPERLPQASPLFQTQQDAAAATATAAAAATGGGTTGPSVVRRRGVGLGGGHLPAAPAPPLPYGGGGGGGGSGTYAHSTLTLASMHSSKARAADAQAVETVIVELGAMFTRMATLVGEQGDTIDRIDADVTEAHANVAAGQEELSKLYRSVQQNRGFILRMFGVLAFVILLVKLLY